MTKVCNKTIGSPDTSCGLHTCYLTPMGLLWPWGRGTSSAGAGRRPGVDLGAGDCPSCGKFVYALKALASQIHLDPKVMDFSGFPPKAGWSLASDRFLGPNLVRVGLVSVSWLVLIQPRGHPMKRMPWEWHVSGDQVPRQDLQEIKTTFANP